MPKEEKAHPPEHAEAELALLYDAVVAALRKRIADGTATASDLEVARKMTLGIGDGRKNAPIRQLAAELPFSSVDEQLS